MNRLYLALASAIVVAGCDLMGRHVAATVAGLLVGFGMLFYSISRGGATRPIGMAAPHLMRGIPKRSGDPTANIGCAIAAAGIGSFAVSNSHYPYQFRIFYGVSIGAGLLIAIVVAFRSRKLYSEPANPRVPD